MKTRNIAICGVALVFLFVGCKKATDPISNSIEGAWELRKLEANLTLNYPPGNGKLLQFTSTEYILFDNGHATDSGTYKIIVDESLVAETGMNVAPGTFNHRILYNNNPSQNKVFIDISNNTLSLIAGAARVADSQVRYTYSRKSMPAR